MFDTPPDEWRIGTLSDLIRESSERIDPGAAAGIFGHYVGLEHIEQGTGRLSGFGRIADVVSQKSVFQPGDILYGKLRPNLRKVARPEFGGVCSTDIVVFRAKHGADPDFAFQLLQSDPLVNHAVATAAGTKMPRTHARSILSFEVAFPPLGEQRRIAEVLRSVDEAVARCEKSVEGATALWASLLDAHFHRADWEPTRPLPSGWTLTHLDAVAKRGSGHTPNKKIALYWGGSIKWVSLQDTKRLDNVYISETAERITSEGIANSSAVLHPAGTVVLTRDATVGRSAITTSEMAVSQHLMAYVCGPKLNTLYLYYWFQRMKPIFERIGAGSTIKTIGLPFFKGLRIALPPMDEQTEIAAKMSEVDGLIASERSVLMRLKSLRAAISHDLLSGRVRVPA